MFARNISDIVLKNSAITVEKKLLLTGGSVEAQVSAMRYSGQRLSLDPAVENARLPPFILAFYLFIFAKEKIPAERELSKFYFVLNGFNDEDFIRVGGLSLKKEAVAARLLRSYPSIIRDFHLYLLMKDDERFFNVTYSLKDDYKNGVDLCFCLADRCYSLSVYLESSRGSSFKRQKYRRHDYSNVTEICLPVNFSSMKKFGEIYLLTDAHLQIIIDKTKELSE